MASVCVIGGGTAGAEAAMEAVRDGAQVTVLERSPRPDPPWASWPDLVLCPDPAGGRAAPILRSASEVTTVTTEARSAQRGRVLCRDGASAPFDTLIVATGSDFSPVVFPGHRKPGVHVLRSADAYADLGRSRSMFGRAVVAGEGSRALPVAERLSGDGRSVHVLVSHWRHGTPSADVLDALKEAAGASGVTIAAGDVARAAGVGSLEAVVVRGRVVPCDLLALLPDRFPRVVPSDALIGRSGGLSVNLCLRTSSSSILAAGGAAELPRPGSRSLVFDEGPGQSGRIAGANSVGHGLTVRPFTRWSVEAFGVRWTGAEAESFVEGRDWPSVGRVSRRWGRRSACTIYFERPRGRALRVESVEPVGAPSPAAPLSSSGTATLRSLAYGGSSDISLVSDTARLGLGPWSDF